MNKKLVVIGFSLVAIVATILTSKAVFAQPEAVKICFYNGLNGADDFKLENLNPKDAICLEDSLTLGIFNNAQTTLAKFRMWHAGMIGTFTDRKNKVHLIRVSFTEGYIVDDTSHKTYEINDKVAQAKWYKIVNDAFIVGK